MHLPRRKLLFLLGVVTLAGSGLSPEKLEASGPQSKGGPMNPDTIELTRKIRDRILAKASEENIAAGSMQKYEGVMTRGKVPVKFGMVPIPEGEFLMGSPAAELKRHADEGPQVRVKISAFWMAGTETAWELYHPFMETPEPRWKDGSRKVPLTNADPVDAVSSPTAPYTDMSFAMGHEGYPAICMTQHAANKFCQWLSAQTGHYYRLPTEAEWEYAARAGTTTAWSFGDDASKLVDYAWYWENSDAALQPVGRKKPNPWGLHDMHGNAAEWVLDQYAPDFYASLTQFPPGRSVIDPFNKPVTPHPRVVRGGSWDDDADHLRSARRRDSQTSWQMMEPQLPKSRWFLTSAQFLGFRIVRPFKIPSLEEMHDAWNPGVVTGVVPGK
ncbi:MAG: hypothetical protein JWL81_1681 [Verrucomicrobiales bacterium]|nr:hypothetical protein [Verrucomicrobiales bacterium]